MCVRRLLVLVVLIAAAVAAVPSAAAPQATVLYVAPHGRDGGSCPLLHPCATLRYATGRAVPGAEVVVETGTYTAQLVDRAHGTPTAPIVIRASGVVTLTRPSPATAAEQRTSLLALLDSSYLEVRGLRVAGMKGRGDYLSSLQPYGGEVVITDHGASAADGRGLVINGLLVEHAANTCIKTEDAETGVLIENNTLLDWGAARTTLDHGIYVSGPFTTIRDNTVRGATGYGIHVYGHATGHDLVVGNRVTGAHDGGILDLRPPATTAGNTVFANGFGISAGRGMTVAGNAWPRTFSRTGVSTVTGCC